MGKVYIVGIGEQAQILAEILAINKIKAAGFFADDADEKEYLGLPILGTSEDMEKVLKEDDEFIVAIGNCKVRERIYERYAGKFKCASAIHPSSIIMPGVKINEGVTIHPGVIIETGAQIGKGAILNTGCIIEHHNIIGNYAHICPGVVLGGKVSIGKTTWVGIGSTVRDHLDIGAYAFVGAGSNVVKPLPDRVLAYGNPAKAMGQSPYAGEAQ
jgi:sugar O-acyltransferase (sialic acid O-acetyltransferase NeuD family)